MAVRMAHLVSSRKRFDSVRFKTDVNQHGQVVTVAQNIGISAPLKVRGQQRSIFIQEFVRVSWIERVPTIQFPKTEQLIWTHQHG